MQDFDAVLKRVALFVIEDWGMMLGDEASEITFNDGESYILAEMDFEGEAKFIGRISILCQVPFADTLTRNLLGLDSTDDVSEVQMLDALREMANVTTGHFVTEAFGVDEKFVLLSPGSRLIPPEDAASVLSRCCCAITGDDNLVVLAHQTPLK